MTTDSSLVPESGRSTAPAARLPRLGVLRILALATGVAAGVGVILALRSPVVEGAEGTFGFAVALLVATVAAFLGGGAVARRRVPDSQFGSLMILTGLAFAAGALAWSPNRLAFTAGQLAHELPQAMVVHLVLAFPDGRLLHRGERSIVACGYATATVLSLAGLLSGDHGRRNLLGVADAPALAEAIGRVQFVGLSGCALLGALLVVRRWRRRRRVAWHWFSLLVGGGVLALTLIAALDEVQAWGDSGSGAANGLRWAVLVMLCVAPVALVAGVLETRLARAAVGDVLGSLQTQPSPGALRDAVARALHDPSVQLFVRTSEGAWTGPDGLAAPAPVPVEGQAVTTLEGERDAVGAIVHDASLLSEPALLHAVSAAAAMSIENGRLHTALRLQVQELTASRQRVVEAGQRERQRLERNLHDGAQQRLVTLSLDVELLAGRLADPGDARQLRRIRAEITAALEELRAVARGIHPAVLSGHGLAVALETLRAESPLPVDLAVDLPSRPPEPVEVVAHHVVREGLANITRHSEASTVRVAVSRPHGDSALVVEVVDDGVGGADPSHGNGLRDLVDRVEALGGTMRIWSPPGSGTSLRAEIPCHPAALAPTVT